MKRYIVLLIVMLAATYAVAKQKPMVLVQSSDPTQGISYTFVNHVPYGHTKPALFQDMVEWLVSAAVAEDFDKSFRRLELKIQIQGPRSAFPCLSICDALFVADGHRIAVGHVYESDNGNGLWVRYSMVLSADELRT